MGTRLRYRTFIAVAGLSCVGCEHPAPESFVGANPVVREPSTGPDARAEFSPEPPIRTVDLSVAGRCVRLTPIEPAGPLPSGPAAECPHDPEPSHTRLDHVRLTVPEEGATVDAELVRSEHDAMRGLMYRTHLPEDSGMLFDLRSREDHKFWMHNTCISLDMLFVDDDGLLVGIVENAPVLSDASLGVGCPSRWVLEVNAGWSRRHGVKAGQHVVLPSSSD